MKNRMCICLVLMIVLFTSCAREVDTNEIDINEIDVYGMDIKETDDKLIINETFDSSMDGNVSNMDLVEKSDDVELGYEVEYDIYSYKSIYVVYPLIKGLESDSNQSVINELLKEEALSFVNILEDNKDELTYQLDYEVVFQDDNFISFIFTGFSYMDGAPYPIDIFYSINIDLCNAKKLVLGDMVLIDESFVDMFVHYLDADQGNEMDNYVCEYLLNSLTTDNFEEGFLKADMLYGTSVYVYSYFTGTNLGISWEVPHAGGDHVEVEIPIEVLDRNIKEGVLDGYKISPSNDK